jgi:hypothetical protein
MTNWLGHRRLLGYRERSSGRQRRPSILEKPLRSRHSSTKDWRIYLNFSMNRQIVTGFIVNLPVIGEYQVFEDLAFLLTLLPSSCLRQPRSARYDRYTEIFSRSLIGLSTALNKSATLIRQRRGRLAFDFYESWISA